MSPARQIEITVLDPHNGEVVGTVPTATADEVARAVATARRARRAWARTAAEERAACLRAMADALETASEELAALNHRETGKSLEDSLGGIGAGVGTLRQYAELGPLHRGHSLRGNPLAADYTVTRPRGVVAVLTPWNDPVAVAMGLVGAGLVTGNVVIHKPSERNPHLGVRLGEILSPALPDGVLQTVSGDGSVGGLLSGDPGVAAIAHVGSSATGAEIARTAADTGAHVIRENGGNDALVIDEGVDPAWAAAQAALGSFANAGQICTSVERIYVHRAVAEPFLGALCEEASRVDAAEHPQPLVDRRHREQVHAQVAAAVESGARLLAGGVVPDGPGAHYPATVLTGCAPEMAVMREETFGPVAPVRVVGDFAEGLQLAAEGRYGLAGTVLTPRIDAAMEANS